MPADPRRRTLLCPPSGTQEERLDNRNDENQKLAQAALSLLKQDQVIFLDASSTHMLLASLLPINLNLTVVTNSPAIATRLLARQTIRTILIGGELNYAVGGTIDSTASEAMGRFRFDLCFFGICAWSSDIGFSAVHYQDAQFKRQAAARASAVVMLCTEDKIETLASYPFLANNDVDYLVCTQKNHAMQQYFFGTDCELVLCE